MSCECHKGSDAYETGLSTLSRRISARNSQAEVCNTDSEEPCITHDVDSKRLRDLMFVEVMSHCLRCNHSRIFAYSHRD